jgi:hypothetical protein
MSFLAYVCDETRPQIPKLIGLFPQIKEKSEHGGEEQAGSPVAGYDHALTHTSGPERETHTSIDPCFSLLLFHKLFAARLRFGVDARR